MKKKPPNYSRLRELMRREQAEELARLTPGERLQLACELSDFCLDLSRRVQEAGA